MNEAFKNKTKEASGEENDKILLKIQTKVYQLKTMEKQIEATEEGATATAATAATPAATTATAGSAAAPTETRYVEIGVGELHLNLIEDDSTKKRARMILRADKTQRLVLNTPIFEAMQYSMQVNKLFISCECSCEYSYVQYSHVNNTLKIFVIFFFIIDLFVDLFFFVFVCFSF
jgi:hypothetical protein